MDKTLKKSIETILEKAKKAGIDVSEEMASLQEKIIIKSNEVSDAWKRVEKARMQERPGTLEYVKLICDEFVELHGDRCYGDDPSLVGGIGCIGKYNITFIGHQKGNSMKENIYRNYGMAHPEGYRKALRLAREAEKFGRPLITFIDTPGAYPGLHSEERGIGEAIATNIKVFSMLKIPILCFVIGEGGSGGALGIGVGDKVYMLENSIYSVISPEGYASILLRDASKAKNAAAQMKLTAQDLKHFGLINGIIPEPAQGAQENPEITASKIREIILENLERLCKKNPETMVRYRLKKITSVGLFSEEKTREAVSLDKKSREMTI